MSCPSEAQQAVLQFQRLKIKVSAEQGGYTIEVYSNEADKIITRTFVEEDWVDGVIALAKQEKGEYNG